MEYVELTLYEAPRMPTKSPGCTFAAQNVTTLDRSHNHSLLENVLSLYYRDAFLDGSLSSLKESHIRYN